MSVLAIWLKQPITLDDSHSGRTLRAWIESLLRFSPKIALGSDTVFIDLPLSAAQSPLTRAKIQSLALRFQIHASALAWGVGATCTQARARALFSRYSIQDWDSGQVSTEVLIGFTNPFVDPSEETKRIQKWIELLSVLGIKTLRRFLELPPKTLASRFGKSALELVARITQETNPYWPEFQPAAVLTESESLVDSLGDPMAPDLEGLLFALKRALDRLCSRALGAQKRISAFDLRIEFQNLETSKTQDFFSSILLPVAQGSSLPILRILRDRLAFDWQKRPLNGPLTFSEITVTETLPSRRTQLDFFDSAPIQAEALDQLLGRLLSKCGKESVFCAQSRDKHLPELSWKAEFNPELSGKNSEELIGVPFLKNRPCRLLQQPAPIELNLEGGLLVLKNRKATLLSSQGPERLGGEWWEAGSTHSDREYYQITLETGENWWVFKSENRFFLHGFFD
jgi:hypothetical protein